MDNLKNISLNLGNFKNINELGEIIKKIKSRETEVSIYDNIYETEQSANTRESNFVICNTLRKFGARASKLIREGNDLFSPLY